MGDVLAAAFGPGRPRFVFAGSSMPCWSATISNLAYVRAVADTPMVRSSPERDLAVNVAPRTASGVIFESINE